MEQLELDIDPPNRPYSFYNRAAGFDNDHYGWHLCVIDNRAIDDTWYEFIYVCEEMVNYLYEKIERCERHCRWVTSKEQFKVKFRYERDAVLFGLRFK